MAASVPGIRNLQAIARELVGELDAKGRELQWVTAVAPASCRI
jgi:hypothetical protein